MKKFLLIIGIALVLIIGGHFLHKLYKYTPRLNHHPKYFLTISGKVDSKHPHKVVFNGTMTYYTTKYEGVCRDVTNFLEGASAAKTKDIPMRVVIDQRGTFTMRIPLDKFRSGYCNWQPMAFGYELLIDNKNIYIDDLGFTNKQKTEVNSQAQSIWQCQVGEKLRCDLVDYKKFNDESTINYKQSPKLSLVFKITD